MPFGDRPWAPAWLLLLHIMTSMLTSPSPSPAGPSSAPLHHPTPLPTRRDPPTTLPPSLTTPPPPPSPSLNLSPLRRCDLEAREPPPGQCPPTRATISEGPGPPGCPPACTGQSAPSGNGSRPQCLGYVHPAALEAACTAGEEAAARLRLPYCCEHSVLGGLSAAVLADRARCIRHLQHLLELDRLASDLVCRYNEILRRYDCQHTYSVNFDCRHCQEAYRRWVCASLLPHWAGRGRHKVRPCRSVCRAVEQRCPFFLPADKSPQMPTNYAGEPVFMCLDPDIPETGEQLARSMYGDSVSEEAEEILEDEQNAANGLNVAHPHLHPPRPGAGATATPAREIGGCCYTYCENHEMCLQNNALCQKYFNKSAPSPQPTHPPDTSCPVPLTLPSSTCSSVASSHPPPPRLPPVLLTLICVGVRFFLTSMVLR
ncbi:unnamed protein product [Bemisia tabaci]|uniref:Uncharacterized protein n=1 Tax=Bemisia tabaci TaxID=7038 RepID=A0A9P0C9D0_BEMTA|nr:unnamed protein product [Bemisia tabaci]